MTLRFLLIFLAAKLQCLYYYDTIKYVFQSVVIMISVVCTSSLLFGNWPLRWDEKIGRFKINYCFIFTSLFIFSIFLYLLYTMSEDVISNETINVNPQFLILCTLYLNNCILMINRWTTVGHTLHFANELKTTCGRTVESGRFLREFWFRTTTSAGFLSLLHAKYVSFSPLSQTDTLLHITVPLACCVFSGVTMECQYTAACHALADEFAAVNRRARAAFDRDRDTDDDRETLLRMSDAHCRLARLVRLFNDEYGVPVFLTTVNLLLGEIFVLNDVVSVLLAEETIRSSYADFTYVFETYTLAWYWYRFWWICHRADCLTAQVHLTAKIMLQKDINSFSENTKKLAFDFLNQLLHRRVNISAWGFYDVNMELLFMILGYQVGLSLICNQFSTTGVELPNTNITSINRISQIQSKNR